MNKLKTGFFYPYPARRSWNSKCSLRLSREEKEEKSRNFSDTGCSETWSEKEKYFLHIGQTVTFEFLSIVILNASVVSMASSLSGALSVIESRERSSNSDSGSFSFGGIFLSFSPVFSGSFYHLVS